jgi:hypothetical protein
MSHLVQVLPVRISNDFVDTGEIPIPMRRDQPKMIGWVLESLNFVSFRQLKNNIIDA